MSLLLWLPLNGSLNNLGLSPVSLTMQNSPVVDNNGKIGKCYDFGTTGYLSGKFLNGPFENLLKNFSLCAWVYLSSNATSDSKRGILSLGGSLIYWTVSGKQFSIKIGSSSNSFNISDSLLNDTWIHLVVTFDNKNIKVYLNGILKKTLSRSAVTENLTSSSFNIATGNNYRLNGKLNDVRVYDHCLSAKEVEEISKGLILHYKLDTAVGLTDLVTLNAPYNIYNNHNNTNMPSTLIDNGTFYRGSKVFRETCTPTDNSLNSIKTALGSHGVYNWRQTFKANTKYVFWIYYKIISNNPDAVCGGTASNIHGWIEIPPVSVGEGWYRVGLYRDGSVTEDKTDNIFVSFKVPSAVSGTPIIIDWASPHLLEGTDEIPNNDDDFYKNIIYDSSGYERNGTVIGTLTTNNNSPRYNACTYFNGSSDIRSTKGSFGWFDFKEGTIAAWYNPANTTQTWASVGIQNDSGQGSRSFSICNYSGKAATVVGYDSSWGNSSSSFSMAANTWYHLCATITNGDTVKLYVNGELVLTRTVTNSTGTVASTTQFAVGVDLPGSDERFTGYLSDVRCYCTALIEKQIKELYDTSAAIDKSGNIYAREVIE